MAPKKGVNTKAEEAKKRKEDVKTEKVVKELKQKEDAAWADEGSKSKAALKKAEAADKKAEAAAKRAEAKKMAEQEEKELEKAFKKASSTSKASKVTAAELATMKEKERIQLAAAAAAAKKRDSRMAEEDEYLKLVEVENTNRMETLVDARSLESALTQISVSEEVIPDRHPERRLKANYKAFEEAELAKLKLERPGMTLTQYKDLIWKTWKKSPLNPMNQTP